MVETGHPPGMTQESGQEKGGKKTEGGHGSSCPRMDLGRSGGDAGTRPQLQLEGASWAASSPDMAGPEQTLLSKVSEAYVSIRKEGGAGGAPGVPQSVLCAFVHGRVWSKRRYFCIKPEETEVT